MRSDEYVMTEAFGDRLQSRVSTFFCVDHVIARDEGGREMNYRHNDHRLSLIESILFPNLPSTDKCVTSMFTLISRVLFCAMK